MNLIIPALQLAGLLHFAILVASFLTPSALQWSENLKPLPPLLRQLFWVYGAFIVLTIVSFGTVTLLHAPEMVDGAPLGRSLSVVIALFWTARLVVQWFVLDAKPFLTRPLYRIGYHLLTVAFVYLSAVYWLAAILPNPNP